MTGGCRPRRRAGIQTEPLPDGSFVLFDADAAMAHPISASAALIWEECSGSQTVDDIVEKLGAVYDAPAETIARDARALLRHLSELGLIVLVDGADD